MEQIETTPDSRDRRTVGQLLFVYMPEARARACEQAQSLDHVPEHMRFVDSDGRESLMAVPFPPFWVGLSYKNCAVVRMYHSAGCRLVTKSDVTGCIVIPKTNFTYNDNRGFFKRHGFGSFDVIATAPVLRVHYSLVKYHDPEGSDDNSSDD
ncbi:hypothetical protein [Bradyrhizobium neotropicale]|uniref:hypothetical protein n=1 Tax=Bradyrhizobium neotropicale TaxID=1497615 RepID=UPI0011AB825C|nr:hypothetical protein [Bradyrhizobium neotropicale]